MQDLSNINTIKEILSAHGFTFSKSLGQNFLINPTVCPRMAEACGADENTAAAQTEYVQTSIAQPAKPVAPEEPKKEDAPYIAKRPAEINPDDEFSIILDSFNR